MESAAALRPCPLGTADHPAHPRDGNFRRWFVLMARACVRAHHPRVSSLRKSTHWSLPALVAAAWLGLMAIINLSLGNDPIRSIVPYAVPVAWVACRTLALGFVIAGLAALSAVMGGAIPGPASESLLAEGLFAYLKLSLVAHAAWLASNMVRSARRSSLLKN